MKNTAKTRVLTSPKNTRPWLTVISAASFVLLINLLINLNVLTPYLSKELHFTAKEISTLFACYYYANFFFVFFAGMILDRFSSRRVLIISFIIANCSTLIFAFTKSWHLMAISRLLLGMVGSFSMLICIRLIQRWFQHHAFLFVTSVVTTYVALGGLIAQTPLAIIIHKVGWRLALILNFLLGTLLCLLAIKYTWDDPLKKTNIDFTRTLNITAIKNVITNTQNWLIGLYTSLSSLPNLFFSANWGIAYLQQANYFTEQKSTLIISANIVGCALGPTLIAWSAKIIDNKKRALLICTLLALVLLLTINYIKVNNLASFIILFFLFGIFASEQFLTYPLILKNNPKELSSTSLGFVASLSALSGVYMPAIGWLIDHENKPPITNNYTYAILFLALSLLISALLILFIKDEKNINYSIKNKTV